MARIPADVDSHPGSERERFEPSGERKELRSAGDVDLTPIDADADRIVRPAANPSSACGFCALSDGDRAQVLGDRGETRRRARDIHALGSDEDLDGIIHARALNAC